MIVQPKFQGKFKIFVKPDAKKDELIGWDDEKQAWRVNIAAPARDNKANVAVIKFFSRLAKKRVFFVSGLRSSEKILFIP